MRVYHMNCPLKVICRTFRGIYILTHSHYEINLLEIAGGGGGEDLGGWDLAV